MSPYEPPPITLGDVLRSGVVLYTREAVSLVAEVCRQAFYAEEPSAPNADTIRIHRDGSVTISAVVSCAADKQMAALARLLESVLPPLGSSEPDYAVRASLRMLAPRARGQPGLAPIEAPETLGSALGQYAAGEPSTVLRELWDRADRALHQYLQTDADGERLTAQAVRAAAAAPDRAPEIVHRTDRFPPEPERTLPPEPERTFRPEPEPTFRPEPELTLRPEPEPTVPDSLPRRSRLDRTVLQMVTALLFAIGFAAGAWLGNHSYTPLREAAADRARSGHGTARPEGRATPPPSDVRHRNVSPHISSAPGEHSPPASGPVDTSSVKGPAFSPSFSEGGREILFHVGRAPAARIVSATLEPEWRVRSLAVLSDDHTRTYHPRRSPDGRFVAFDSDREGTRAVYVARRDWSEVTRVSGEGMAALPSWSPNMKWLAIVRGEPARPHVWNLWLREVRTGALTRLTNYRFGQTWNASWFPDSKLVCYSHEDELVVLDITTGATRAFPSPRRGHLVRTPAVSPDGTMVIFQVHRDGVWLLDLSSGSMRRVLDDPSAEEFAWDPRGTRVAYHSRRDGSWRIWLMAVPTI
jgi:WD40-like Beta Propeller Repeat